MKKNLHLTALAIALSLATSSFAQTGRTHVQTNPNAQLQNNNPAVNAEGVINIPHRTCGSQAPSTEWDAWFNQKVAEYLAANPEAKTQMVGYTIPVVFHIIHTGQGVGTFPNLAQAQINSQIPVLNADYAGTGFNVGGLPAPWAGTKANTGISFCLATKNPTGGVLPEPGIDRVNSLTMAAALTGTFTSKDPANAAYAGINQFQGFIDGYIKPNTIWPAARYFNVWVTNEQAAVGLLGYATFPIGTGLTGITGNGTATTDGVWLYSAACGSKGIYAAGTYGTGFEYGRTLSHESGHWLGLRHIGGDGNGNPVGDCTATDYCNDTPPQKGGNAGGAYGQNYGCGPYPLHANVCPGQTNGDMFMNFMDYSDDACCYFFTVDQNTRMQTAMANGTYRNQLSISANTLCVTTPAAPVSNFGIAATACKGTGVTTSNGSTGNPSPTFVWSSNPVAGVSYNPNNTASTPIITFTNNGTYTITCAATNSVGTNSSSKIIVISTCVSPCADTLSNFTNTDTLTVYKTGTGAGCTTNGYVAGNNCYGDKEKAEWYSSTGLVGTSKIIGGIVLFYRHPTAAIGTHGSSNAYIKVYNGNNVTGPSGAAINNFTVPLTSIAAVSATNNVQYCGNPSLGFATNIIRPYSFNYAAATNITGDFLMSVQLPTAAGDTVAIFMDSGLAHAGSTAWEMWSDNSWNDFLSAWTLKSQLAILPKIACVTGVYNPNGISGNIAVFPNPSNGMFNFAITMPQPSDLNFTVINNIGQVVYSKIEKSVGNAVIGMDLGHLAKGIYFVNIIDGIGDKVTKKIIIE